MSRLQRSFNWFSKDGLKFLVLELTIVFLGVYLAFLFQNYTSNLKLESEKEKVLIGLKEELEFFRIFYPGYSTNAQSLIQNWNEVYSSGSYDNYFTWRFLQPQYDYTDIEYALNADADVISFEIHSRIAEVYQEIQKLRHAESLMTELAMEYKKVPSDLRNDTQSKLIEANNLHNFRLFIDRGTDRQRLLQRIAELSDTVLPVINDQFEPEVLKSVEIELISQRLSQVRANQIDEYIPQLLNFFPNLTEQEIRFALESSN